MLTVINNNLIEPILESNYEKFEEQNGNSLQISFTSYDHGNNYGHSLIESNVIIEDEDGNRYKVRQLNETPKTKQVLATHIYYDLIGFIKNGSFTGNNSFNQYANWLFEGSGWTFENVDINRNFNFNTFGNDNFIQLIQRLITGFDCEFKILPNRVIRFANRITRNEEKQYRYGLNIKEISRSIDTSNIRTRITAYGANGLNVRYDSPLITNPLFGVLEAPSVRDENITDANELMQLARTNLKDTPDVNLEVSVLELDGEVGDSVYVIHEEMNLEFQTRILSKTTRRNYDESVVELGNTIRRTIEDAIIDQKVEVQNNKVEAEENLNELEEKTDRELATLTVGQKY